MWLGRANFAGAALAAPAAYAFVLALANRPLPRRGWLWAETLLLAALSLFTSRVDAAETVRMGQHVSTYGPLFPLYLLHILGFAGAGLWIALRPAFALSSHVRAQLRLVGMGILLGVGFVTNAALPYWFGNFHYINVGTLSTIFFLAVVAYAAANYHLFNVRVLVKKTVVFALLIAFTLELYQLAVGSLTELLPLGDAGGRHAAAVFVALTVNAFTHEPLRRWLDRLADQLLSGRNKPNHHTARHARRGSSTAHTR